MVKTFDEAYELLKPYPSDFFMSIMLAQWALESDKGRSELALKANNFTGHKAQPNEWPADRVYKKDTIEDDGEGTKFIAPKEPFRLYHNPQEWAKHHASWMQRKPSTYAKAISAKTVEEQARALQGTYATDTAYAEKLMDVIKANDLTMFDKKESDTVAKLTLEQAFAKLGLKFSKQLLPLNKTFGRVNRKQGTVVHQTGAPQANKTAQWMADYQKTMSSPSNPEEKSWNYQVDDKEAIMSFEHNVATWQASDGNGPGNMAHISIESCINAGANYAKGIENLAKTMAVIAYIENFNIEKDTKRHYDFARDKKWCPAQIMNGQGGFTYAKVKAMAQGYLNTLNSLTGSSPEPAPNTDFDLPAYKEPTKSFKAFKTGDTVTVRNPHEAWYIPATNQGRKPSKDFTGQSFKVERVINVEVGYSKRAYLLSGVKSFLLEQDIVEARADWNTEEKDQQEQLDYVYIDGVKRAIGDVIK